MATYLLRLLRALGWREDATSHAEKLISALGAFCALGAVWVVTHWVMPAEAALWVVASTGASAVLLFAVPHGPLSQPWAVFGGQLISAFVGISCQQLLADHPLTPALAVALAILAMHYARCIHPPGGATALTYVLAGPGIHALGYQFLLTPVLLNVGVILLVAVLFNSLFPWRRYPAALARQPLRPTPPPGLAPEDIHHALRQMDSYIDIRFDDLLEIMQLAHQHAAQQRPHATAILLGACYSNGQPGAQWSIRQVTGLPPKPPGRSAQAVYRVIAGNDVGGFGSCRVTELAAWAQFAVRPSEHGWQRCSPEESRLAARLSE
ncbi:HPP family protein [Pseudomonas linyingensis]|uniref:HPP family protein n=1 Tax=Pseudomonas linyingensis TaxID=915471 RepID=A0A1H6TU64_9PSED|nr:HPP family protein [Pseudomonas linyingensis]SEI83618.1 HPP family protein [Pseudomonas linyingensis]